MSKTYNVNGMTCQGCANSVTNAIKGVAPDSEISVNLDANQITVDGLDDDAAVAKAIDDAGFEFAGAA